MRGAQRPLFIAEGAEDAAGHCWLPLEAAPVIARVHERVATDAKGQKISQPSEAADRTRRADPAGGICPLRHARQAWERAA